MNSSILSLTTRPSLIGHALRDAGLLLAVVGLMALPVGMMAYQGFGQMGLVSTGVAAAVCFGSAILSLVVALYFREPSQAVVGLLLGMGLRAGVPMLFGGYMTQIDHPLAAAGLFGQIVLFYLAGLCAETVLRIGQLKRQAGLSAVKAVAADSSATNQVS